MAMTRHYRAQHSLATAPLILVYSIAMAATAVTFALGSPASSGGQPVELAQHISFLLKALNDCAETYDVAGHIGERLRREIMRAPKRCGPEGSDQSLSADANIPQDAAPTNDLSNCQTSVEVGLDSTSSAWWDFDFSGFEDISDYPN